jgi:hypothetical protein
MQVSAQLIHCRLEDCSWCVTPAIEYQCPFVRCGKSLAAATNVVVMHCQLVQPQMRVCHLERLLLAVFGASRT